MHPLHGVPLGLHIAQRLAAMPLLGRVAICPDSSGDRAGLFRGCGFTIVANAEADRGLASSLALGADEALRMGAEAMLVCLADMPHVSTGHLAALLAATPPGGTAATRYGSTGGPPVVFTRPTFDALRTLTGDHGARPLLAGAALVEAASDQLRDYDTPADFEA